MKGFNVYTEFLYSLFSYVDLSYMNMSSILLIFSEGITETRIHSSPRS